MEIPRRSNTIPSIPLERRSLIFNPKDILPPRLAEERMHKMSKTYKTPEAKKSTKMLNTPKILKATVLLSRESMSFISEKPIKKVERNKTPSKILVRNTLPTETRNKHIL